MQRKLSHRDTVTELNFLRDEVLAVLDTPMFWIGATLSRTCEDTVRYRRKGVLMKANWAQEQPYFSGDKFCVGTMLHEEDLGMYFADCCDIMYFVCDKNSRKHI